MSVRTHFMRFFVPLNSTTASLEEKVEHFLQFIEEDLNGKVVKCEATDSEHAYIVYQIIT